ncbi:MAG TPA: TadE/TadG family type IV pilus assembly protein [Candidatus Limnocylindrales bacterium]|nr:TadE/TadG family type IV pilus assembly protein [Candidatus Limnocylindrales bacterium]
MRARGQALAETALLFPLLMLLVLGSADLGRLFYYAVEVTNAAREGARQGVAFDPALASNPNDTYAQVLSVVRSEASDLQAAGALSTPTASPSHCLPGAAPYGDIYYPSTPNTGWVYICFDGNESSTGPALSTIRVTVLFNATPITPMLSDFIGGQSGSLHIVASTLMNVQGAG